MRMAAHSKDKHRYFAIHCRTTAHIYRRHDYDYTVALCGVREWQGLSNSACLPLDLSKLTPCKTCARLAAGERPRESVGTESHEEGPNDDRDG